VASVPVARALLSSLTGAARWGPETGSCWPWDDSGPSMVFCRLLGTRRGPMPTMSGWSKACALLPVINSNLASLAVETSRYNLIERACNRNSARLERATAKLDERFNSHAKPSLLRIASRELSSHTYCSPRCHGPANTQTLGKANYRKAGLNARRV
jgi:hypothetical protein